MVNEIEVYNRINRNKTEILMIAMKEQGSLFTPIDQIEEMAIGQDWAYSRLSASEIAIEISGRWSETRLECVWYEEQSILSFSNSLEILIQPSQVAECHKLLALINENMLLGHFDILSNDNSPTLRYGMMILDQRFLNPEYFYEIIQWLGHETERFYPAFQAVLMGDKKAQEAASLALFETMGEA